jgi:hypothetical protein
VDAAGLVVVALVVNVAVASAVPGQIAADAKEEHDTVVANVQAENFVAWELDCDAAVALVVAVGVAASEADRAMEEVAHERYCQEELVSYHLQKERANSWREERQALP